MFPSIFLSHGAPTLGLTDTPARTFLQGLGQSLGTPRAILVASAHWETREPRVNAVAVNETIYDFRGFPKELYAMRYPAPGSPALAARVMELLQSEGLATVADTARGLDHGAWVPLQLMYPDASIPVVQIALQSQNGPAYHMALGRALAPLRAEDILIMGSGSFTHDLGRFRGQPLDEPAPPDVVAFADWFDKSLVENRTDDLLHYRQRAPYAAENHPTEEHLLPLFVALGASGENATIEHLHASSTYGILRMDAYAFKNGSP